MVSVSAVDIFKLVKLDNIVPIHSNYSQNIYIIKNIIINKIRPKD